MTSFDDLLKFSNNMSLKRPDEVDPMASAIWHSLIEDYYKSLDGGNYVEGSVDKAIHLQPPGITMRTINLPTS